MFIRPTEEHRVWEFGGNQSPDARNPVNQAKEFVGTGILFVASAEPRMALHFDLTGK